LTATAPIHLVGTPRSSSSGVGSPEVELLALNDELDDAFEPPLAILGEDDKIQEDPTTQFPYNDFAAGETYAETVNRLVTYFSSRAFPLCPRFGMALLTLLSQRPLWKRLRSYHCRSGWKSSQSLAVKRATTLL